MMKYININRTDEECLNNVLNYIKNADYKDEKNRKKAIKDTLKYSIKEIRYIDNNYRIYHARKNWEKIKLSLSKKMNKQLQNEIIESANKKLAYVEWFECGDRGVINHADAEGVFTPFFVIHSWYDIYEYQDKWHRYDFRYVKKYNKENASNKDNCKQKYLSKKELLEWCEINNIKCAKSKKYGDIVKLLMQKL